VQFSINISFHFILRKQEAIGGPMAMVRMNKGDGTKKYRRVAEISTCS
jgi:hypothetical protein